ncbi:helix-turn-helix transcriptional regulator [Actinoallomurus bryophytorum]|uniref:Helix-turn-helix protein n=1 Tax=Actinoallomurus bryophytorum TaxID=1490222 RepID=A0A543CLY6_9ACTN|nr:helix-turn-helix transcriptional regulator [Actinoallomurus bryophytorum]TQL97927.1 helix-turn-helix protein [Actinoallomurus bryophytorum]
MEYTPMAIWGRELKHYRQAAGLTQAELAQRINYSTSLISQIETGQVPATVEFAESCDKQLTTGGTLTRTLDYRKGSAFPTWFGKWLPYEQGADVLRTFQPNVIYGLLQTEAYARALLDGDVTARMERQLILDQAEPPTLHVVLDETVLWRNVGGAEVMYEQLMHLVESSSRSIKIQVLPSDVNLGTQGPFVLATLENGSTAAYLETAVRGLVTVAPDDIARAEALWESIKAEALPLGMSKELIKRTAEERWVS